MTDRPAEEIRSSVVVLFPDNQTSGVADVERINQFWFYEFGKELKELAVHEEGVQPHTVLVDVMTARNTMKALVDEGRPIPLGLSRGPATTLLKHLDGIMDQYFTVVNEAGVKQIRFPQTDAPPIPDWTWSWYRNLLTKFETIFSEEMREAATYYVPRRGIFWTPALVDSAEESFPLEVRPHLPPKTIADWRAAGRCLAFNLLSASGFHVARAVEGIAEAYYQLFSGIPGGTCNSWGDYAKEFDKIAAKKPSPCPSEKTMAEFKQMKDDYRNPVMHPRVVLSEADARMLFDNGESLIIAMAQEIAVAKESGMQVPLALAGGIGVGMT